MLHRNSHSNRWTTSRSARASARSIRTPRSRWSRSPHRTCAEPPPGSGPARTTAPGAPGIRRRTSTASAPTLPDRAAPNRCSSAAPPLCRSPSPARRRHPYRRPARPRSPGRPSRALGSMCRANVEAPIGQNVTAVLISPPQALRRRRPTPDRRHQPRPTADHHRPRTMGRQRSDAMREHRVRQGHPGRHRAPHGGQQRLRPEDSAGIIRSIYEYHTRELGWCDIAYNAMVDKYGQVFEGRAGGMDKPVEGSHTGGFNIDTWGVAMLGDFDVVPPTEIQVRNTGRLLGWRLGLDHIDPRGSVVLTSAGGSFTHFPRGAAPTLPTIFTHRDVGITDCPGNAHVRPDGPHPRHRRPVQPATRPGRPGRIRCVAARSTPGGSADRRCERHAGQSDITRGPPVKAPRAMRPSSAASCTGHRTAAPSRSPAPSARHGERSVSSAESWAFRPVPRFPNPSGSCRTSSTAR